jgi:2-polyprenyl-3-methyl-5-hydroxy-6-metoxy-1,4-benzoquinol methylase
MDMQAIQKHAMAIAQEPDNFLHKENFMNAAADLRLRRYNPDFKMFFLNCLEARSLGHKPLQGAWHSLLRVMPGFRRIYALHRKKNYAAFEKAFLKIKGREEALGDPYFLLGLHSFVVPDAGFERLIAYLRRFLSQWALQGGQNGSYMNLAQAVASYCFQTEYIMPVSAEETQALIEIRRRIDERKDLPCLLVQACYAPLNTLPGFDGLAGTLREGGIAEEFIKEQIEDFIREQDLRRGIGALTELTDDLSKKVAAQYEDFPYPRWKSLGAAFPLDTLERFLPDGRIDVLKKDGARFLVAGCGTGLQALQYALAFPGADILAIDLSKASLAYGKRKAQERQIGNITFKQADILGLSAMPGTYDFILCTGVLHHMADPASGLSVLSGLLGPEGLMRIALYSETARQFIVRIHKVIEERQYGNTSEEIRRFRNDCPRILRKADYKCLLGTEDFYKMSECRDLLFHAHELRLAIPEIDMMLHKSGLSFLKFEVPGNMRALYHERFPDDTAETSLENWHEFEQTHPGLFLQMYRFWCCRKGA